VESYAPCLELVDYALPKRDLATMFAHSFFHAGLILGAPVPAQSFAPLPPALPSVHGGAGQTRTPSGATVPSDVVVALHGLVERVLEAGGALRRGQVVLCGSYIEPMPLLPGSTVRADFGPLLSPLSVSRAPE
jgi:2-oxo-hept-3-ene-1,7-dioate hydratase